ncbi:hypothetical protein BC830DRAFT_67834 [Chytriomyces sp. MP71]|nr:hypothetical protein BC830DRAFT_67834 [Chytriomyces sp. MP71]
MIGVGKVCKNAQPRKLSTETKNQKVALLARTIITIMEIAKLVMPPPPSNQQTPTDDQLPSSPRRAHLPSPLSITGTSEYSRSMTMAEPAQQSTTIPGQSWPNCYPSPPTEDQTNEQKIISEILLNSPTCSTGAMDDLPVSPAEGPKPLSLGAPETSVAFLYPQIGKPTSTKCERFMEFMRMQERRRIRPRTMLEVRAEAQEGQSRRARRGIVAGAGVSLPYLRSPPRKQAERSLFVPTFR